VSAALLLAAASMAQALVADKAFQHYVRNAWATQEGLPQVSANAIAQDGAGYIWVGTQTGLARFDGVRFVTFTPADTPALPGAWVRALLADRVGAIWIGTYQGLAMHDGHSFRTIQASDPQRYPALDILDLAIDSDGTILAATDQGVFKVVAGVLVALAHSPRPAWSLLVRDDGLWVAGTGSVVRLADGKATPMPLPADAATVAITCLREAQGRIWLGSSRGLFVRGEQRWLRADVPPRLASAMITMMIADRDDNLWVGSDAGLARLRGQRVVEWVGADGPGHIKGLLSGFEDREGNLWLGSQSEGVIRVWSGWTRRYSVAEGLHEPLVWSLSKAPDGRLWVGTNDGVSVFAQGRFHALIAGNRLPHPQAYNLLAEAGQTWIGTRRGLALWRDGRVQTPALFAPMANAQINGIVRDPEHGDLWFPTSNGLFRLHAGELRRLEQEPGPATTGVRFVLRTRAGTWLAGGQGGLFALRNERLLGLGRGQGLPARLDVTAIHELPGGQLVVGALDGSSYVFDHARWQALGPSQGMPANVPFFIAGDDAGSAWLAGMRGITRAPVLDLERFARGEIARVAGEMIVNERGDLRSGQQSACCNGAGNAKGVFDQGTLWLPSRDGIVALRPSEVTKNPVAPSVAIESVRIGAQSRELDGAPLGRLPESARDLQFAFTALSFQDPRSTLIQYRLDGYDAEWHTLGDGEPRRANYTNLPPGPYRFAVRAANNAGVWAAAPAQLAFTIPPRMSETGWFSALLALLATTALMLFLRWLHLRHRRLQARLQRLVDARTIELSELNLRLQEASQTDPLTGLRNRRFLELQMPADIGFYDRENPGLANHEQILLFALLDIDHFKAVNDRHGHGAGDSVLQQVAQLLSRLLRSGDYIVRWGGEEFLLVFRPMGHDLLGTIGERLRREIAEHAFELPDRRALRLTASIGLCEYPLFSDTEHRLGWEDMIELADRALYWVKQHGRDGWAAFRPTASTRMAPLIAELREGVEPLLNAGQLQLLGSHPPSR